MRRSGALAWVVLGLVLLAVFAIAVGFASRAYYYPMGMPYYYGGWFFFPFGFIFIFFLIFVVSRLVFWPWGWGWRRGYYYHYGDAREILRQRYARGEISKDQYDQMMRDLEQSK